jgi:hypothetical protein
MKTTIEIRDDLLVRAKRFAKRSGRPLRAVVEDGLRRVLADAPRGPAYELPDRSVGEPGQNDPLEAFSWHELRDEIYSAPR